MAVTSSSISSRENMILRQPRKIKEELTPMINIQAKCNSLAIEKQQPLANPLLSASTTLYKIQRLRFYEAIAVVPFRPYSSNASSSAFGVLADLFAVAVASSFLGAGPIVSATRDASITSQFGGDRSWWFFRDGTIGIGGIALFP